MSKTLLLVDDEAVLNDVHKEIFQLLGWNVYTATDGESALTVFREHRNEIDAVVMDVNMPRLNGWKASEQLLELKSSLRIVLTSGLFVPPPQGYDDRVQLLNKPFDYKELEALLQT